MDSDATKNKYRKNAVSTNTKANIVMVDNGEDRISKLPDDILNHILSSLPTKDAVGTIVLSKRWNGLWTFINNLDFDDGMLFSHKNATATEKQHFVNFVNRVLHRLSSSTLIHDVTLRLTTFKDECPQHHINAWISAFLRKGVQKLCIKYRQKAPVDFCALFHSISLAELEMKMLWTVTRVPSNSCLRNLQILNISYTMIVGDNIQSKEMVFNFPLLKVFIADHCIWLDTEKVILNTPMLESLSMTCYSFLKSTRRSPWSYEPWSTTINIFAPHLRKFLYKGPLSEEIILSDPLSILHVFLEIYHMKNRHAMCQPVVRECMPLKEFHRVETLQLGYFLAMMLCHPNDQLSVLPLFGQLVCLMLDLGSSSQFPEVLLNLLHKSPILQRLVLFCALPEFDRELLTSELPPPCLVSSLKIIEIKSGSWSGGNVFLVKYMLEKARMLEKLTINLCMQDRVSVKNVTDEVLSFPKASKNISIKVERTPWKKINGREINV